MFKKILVTSLIVLQILTQSACAFEFQPILSIPVQPLPIPSFILKNENLSSVSGAFSFFKISDSFVNQPLAKGQGLSVFSNDVADQTLSNPAGWRLTNAYLRAPLRVRIHATWQGLRYPSSDSMALLSRSLRDLGKAGYSSGFIPAAFLGKNVAAVMNTYDSVGNRDVADSVTYTPNSLNQYTAVGSATYTNGSNGNITSDGTSTFGYDAENRLVSFDTTGTSNDATYAYDALSRRVSKNVNGTPTYFIYDGDDIIADYSSGSLLREYIHGDGIDEILAMQDGSDTYYYHYDGLGSVTEITDDSGAVVENYTYDVFGTPSVTTSSIGNRYRFTGREYDEESGLYHYRARAYSPTIGRFLQRDPIGNVDSENLYQYTLNNPINYTDPSGEIILDIASAGLDAYFFLDSLKKFNDCPGIGTGFNLAVDSLSFIPFVPTLGFLTRIDNGLDLINVSIRTTRKGLPGVSITTKEGKVIDITPERVKEFVPEPKAKGGLKPVKFEDAILGTKGKKRLPSEQELDLLRKLTGKK